MVPTDATMPGSAESPGLVDVHTHAIPPSLPDLEPSFPWGRWPTVERDGTGARILVGGRQYRTIDARSFSAPRRLADMDAEGIAMQVVSPAPITLCHDAPAQGAAMLAAAQNEFLADLVSQSPGRLRALGAVPLQDPDAAIAELRRCAAMPGFIGVEIGTRVGEAELGDSGFDGFFRAATDLGAVVFVHPVDTSLDPRLARLGVAFGAGMPSDTGVAGAALLASGALARRPQARICLAHGGGTLPWLLPRLDRGARIGDPDLPSDLLPSALARTIMADSLTYDAASLLLAARRYGTENLMLGTDYPFAAREAPPAAVLEEPCEGMNASVRDAIGWRNATALLTTLSQPQTSRVTRAATGKVT